MNITYAKINIVMEKGNIISFMYFGYHYKIIKTVNKEHFIHLN